MIGMAAYARRMIGPREVLQAAPVRMRVQFWFLVVSGIALATVPVLARGESMPSSSWVPYWPFIGTVILWTFSAGAVWAQFNSLKDRLVSLEGAVVKKDKLDDKLETMTAKIDALHRLLERSDRDWRDAHHGSKE